MKITMPLLIATFSFSAFAGASGIPHSAVPDFTKWGRKTLKDAGIKDARVIETEYPFNLTFCRNDSSTLWRYDLISREQLSALKQGKSVKPLAEKERTVVVEPNSPSCRNSS